MDIQAYFSSTWRQNEYNLKTSIDHLIDILTLTKETFLDFKKKLADEKNTQKLLLDDTQSKLKESL
jgi:hypothetical protein